MLNWIEHELNTVIDLRKAFLEAAGITATLIFSYLLITAIA